MISEGITGKVFISRSVHAASELEASTFVGAIVAVSRVRQQTDR